MDNVLQTNAVPLTVFGGAVPELAPEDLPEGASPYNQDCDFNPGSVFTRGGRINQYTYGSFVFTKNTTLAVSTSDAPLETAWANPSNATIGTIGTDAIVNLQVNTPLDLLATGGGVNNTVMPGFPATWSLVTGSPNDFPVFTLNTNGSVNTPSGWQLTDPLTNNTSSYILTANSGIVAAAGANVSVTVTNVGAGTPVPGMLTLFQTNGTPPNRIQLYGHSNSGFGTIPPIAVSVPISTGTMLIAFVSGATVNAIGATMSDNLGNVWLKISETVGFVAGGYYYAAYFACTTVTPGTTPTVTCSVPSNSNGTVSCSIGENQNLIGIVSGALSQQLQCTNYGFSFSPGQQILGMQVQVQGKQSTLDPGAQITVALVPSVAALANPPLSVSTQLNLATESTRTLGTPTTNWGLQLAPALLSGSTFGVQVQARSLNVLASFAISAVKIVIYATPPNPSNINYIRTYEQTDGEIDTIMLDATGVLWDEDVDTNPTVFNSIFNSILPNTFAKSVTFNDIEYIAFSNLVSGTDVPRQWNGTNLDRISMVGPGAACSAAVSGGSGGSNTTAIQSITQGAPTQIRRIVWGATPNAINDSTPGNLLLIMGEGRTGANTYQSLPPYTQAFGAGTTVVLSSITSPFPLKGGGSLPYNLNGTYTVTQVTTGIVGGNETVPLFTVPAPATQYGYSSDFGSGGTPTSGWFYQSALATVTLQAPLPNIGVGSQIQITGTGGSPPSGYDGTWTVLQAPNASAMTINSVILSGNVATYSFTLVAGSAAPTVGQLVSVANCLNGSGIGQPGIFNVTNVAIQSVGGGTFSIPLTGPDIPLQNQIGDIPPATANVGGTIFVFDPAQIVGNKTGGSIVSSGQVGVGVRKVCYSFLTRSGYITQPSPIATFNITSGAGSITVSGLSPGPSNVVARIVFFTGANGGNFFYIPQTVFVTVSGQAPIKNDSTIVNDNTSTTATFSFSDAVLLSALAIDIPGNNLFNTIELGSCRGLLTYAARMFAWSEQLKVTNLRNLSFDGGFTGQVIQGANVTAPLGWSLDATNGSGGSLNFSSPVFGWAYQINNTSGITQTTYGMLTQPAYQDEFGVPIIQAATLYSVRITALCQPQPQGGGNLVVDLFSATVGAILGSSSIPLASMTTTMQIYTGTLLTTILQPVPKDLVIRIYATSIANGAQILIDRVEPFQTLVPVATTSLKASYANNQEAFDLVTGVCGPAQNSQPLNGALELFDLLYALKEKSWFSTFDNGVTEPNKWTWKEVSNKVGTIGIHSYDWGEGWAVSANRQGAYFFEGGEPIKISQEIQPVWDAINWQYGYTLWMRNDPEQRRITIGIPIATPNQWMPEFPVNANPTSPNVVLMCNYRELTTGAALAQTGPIRSTFTGRLMSPEPARKWSFWNIACPYSDFISRANNQWPQFYCSGYQDSKIFALVASQLSDDGNAINSFWISYGFVKPEMADAKGLGLFRMEFPYFTVLAVGSGQLNSYVYPESPFNRPYALDPQTLPTLTQGDLEIGVNIKGQRFFVRVGTNAVGAGFRCSKMVVPLIPDTWAPIRGYNVITA